MFIVSPCTAATMGSSQEPDLSDVRIYRRSNERAAPIVRRSDSAGTLGSGGRKSRSPAVNGPSSLAANTAKDYPELVRRQLRWDSFSDTRSSVRASATSSPAATSLKGTALLEKYAVTQKKRTLVTSLLISSKFGQYTRCFITTDTPNFQRLSTYSTSLYIYRYTKISKP